MWDYAERDMGATHFFITRAMWAKLKSPTVSAKKARLPAVILCDLCLRLIGKERADNRGKVSDLWLRQCHCVSLCLYGNDYRQDAGRSKKITNQDIADYLGGLPVEIKCTAR